MIRISRQRQGNGKWLLESPWGNVLGDLGECFIGAHRLVNIEGEDRAITWKRFETELLEVFATGNEGEAVQLKGTEDGVLEVS